MSGFTDIHAHFLYGLDDGARTRADMESMLNAAFEQGISTLFATPHTTPGIEPFDREAYMERLEEARTYCRDREYAIRILSGSEAMYTPVMRRFAEERRLQTLADSPFLLLEFVPDISFAELEEAVEMLERTGYVPVLAHIERYACMARGNAYRLKKRYDVRYQINCASILDRRGFWTERRIRAWIRDGIIDCIASDAHDCRRRSFRMQEAYTALAKRHGEDCARKLTGLEG